jgi:hypothetical protein
LFRVAITMTVAGEPVAAGPPAAEPAADEADPAGEEAAAAAVPLPLLELQEVMTAMHAAAPAASTRRRLRRASWNTNVPLVCPDGLVLRRPRSGGPGLTWNLTVFYFWVNGPAHSLPAELAELARVAVGRDRVVGWPSSAGRVGQ